MKLEHYAEIAGIVVFVAAGVVEYWREKKNAKAAAIGRAIMITLLGTTLTTVMIIRWEIIPRIESNQELARLISSEQSLKTTLDLGAAALPVAKGAPAPFREIFNEKLDDFNTYLADAALKKFVFPRDEILPVATRVIQAARSSITGTSYVKSSEWWGTPDGLRYLQLHSDLIKSGVKIRRLFVFSSINEMANDKQLMETQKKMGIGVWYVLATDVPDFTDDMILVDGSICAELRLNPDKGMRLAEFYCDEKNFKRISSKIESLMRQAKEFQ